MGQKKLIRFAELLTFDNVLQYPEGMAGKWSAYFGNCYPLVLELACGKGEYSLGLAQLYPEKNFLGIDQKGNRIWVGAKKALQQGLKQVAFLRTQIDRINEFFARGEVDEIWITFPDPQLRLSKTKKRLTHPKFLRMYQQLLKPSGKIHLKTDSPSLYHFTKTVIAMYDCTLHQDMDDVYARPQLSKDLQIKTHYEGLNISGSGKIHYLCFSLPEVLPSKEQDAALHELLKQEAGQFVMEKEEDISEDENTLHFSMPQTMIEGQDFYLNEQGLMVLTERHHLNRGYCCGNGCKHCPFAFDAVPEPKRSLLLGKNATAHFEQ
jgi:tRNA (guanine-N7-)-methyltransferase